MDLSLHPSIERACDDDVLCCAVLRCPVLCCPVLLLLCVVHRVHCTGRTIGPEVVCFAQAHLLWSPCLCVCAALHCTALHCTQCTYVQYSTCLVLGRYRLSQARYSACVRAVSAAYVSIHACTCLHTVIPNSSMYNTLMLTRQPIEPVPRPLFTSFPFSFFLFFYPLALLFLHESSTSSGA